jgi:Fibronectin type III domain
MNWTKFPLRAFLSAAGVVLLLAGPASLGHGLPITSITDLNNFRDTRSLNDVGILQGDTIQYGANVVPNDAAGTQMAATQGTFRNPTTGYFPCGAITTNPNFCAKSVKFNLALTGQWNLEFWNGGDTATAVTPPLAPSAVDGPAPFPVNVTITGSGTTPTLSWTVPVGFTPNNIRVNIYDKNKKNSLGAADIIFSNTFGGNAPNFTVPDNVNLVPGNAYVLAIQLIETRDNTSSTGGNNNISRRSSSFFDFTPLPGGAPPDVHLPTVGPPPDPGSGFGATYQFSVTSIVPGGKIFIDPYLAVGYDYAIGPGDPNFASVQLPAVQSDPFILSFQGPSGVVSVPLPAGQEYFFPSGGVDRFSVRGISLSANLDPANVTAFITGLTFAGAGNFTGTMTPVIVLSPAPTLIAPDNLTVTPASSSQINLSWTDQSTNETGFQVERKTGAGGTYGQIATAAANTTTYSDNGLAEGTTYVYRVRAVNATDNSAYSNEASGATPSSGTGGSGGGGGGGCSISPEGKSKGEFPLGTMLALFSPGIFLVVRKAIHRK